MIDRPSRRRPRVTLYTGTLVTTLGFPAWAKAPFYGGKGVRWTPAKPLSCRPGTPLTELVSSANPRWDRGHDVTMPSGRTRALWRRLLTVHKY